MTVVIVTIKSQCIKGNNSKISLEKRTKKFETSKKFNRQRKEDLERIITDEGILLRIIEVFKQNDLFHK